MKEWIVLTCLTSGILAVLLMNSPDDNVADELPPCDLPLSDPDSTDNRDRGRSKTSGGMVLHSGGWKW